MQNIEILSYNLTLTIVNKNKVHNCGSTDIVNVTNYIPNETDYKLLKIQS